MKYSRKRSRHFTLCSLVFVLAPCCALAQVTPNSANDAKRDAALRAARQFAETAIAESKELRLDENHILIECMAAEVFRLIDPQQARALLRNVLVRLNDEDFVRGPADDSARQRRLSVQQRVLQTIARDDPNFILENLGKQNLGKHNGEDTGLSQYRRELELNLAARVALQEPGEALKLAEKNLGDEIPYQYAHVISALWQKDAPAAVKLAQTVVSAFRRASVQARHQNLSSALNLLSVLSQLDTAEQAQPASQKSAARNLLVASLQQLADFAATEALAPDAQAHVLSNVSYSLDQFDKYAPAKYAALKERVAQWKRQNPQADSQEEFSRLSANASVAEQLEFVANAPTQIQNNFYQQIASTVSQKGDFEQARQIILQYVTEPGSRSQMLRNLAREAAWHAGAKDDFHAARSYALEGAASADERAAILAQVVTSAGDRPDKGRALAILEEAARLLNSPPETFAEFSASVQVAGAFAPFDRRRAAEILEAAAGRINEVLNGMVLLDGFLPHSRSFENGELLLETGFASSSLIGPYAQAAGALARHDPSRAGGFAQKLQRPEARAQVYLGMARELTHNVGVRHFRGTVGLRRGRGLVFGGIQ